MTPPREARDEAVEPGGFDAVDIPVGGRFWRALGGNGALAIGYALAALHVLVLVTVSVVLSDPSRLDYAAGRRLVTVAILSTLLLPILAMCALWIGELIRRGRWGGPAEHKPAALLPQGSVTVRMRVVATGWLLLWFAIAGSAAGLILWYVSADGRRFVGMMFALLVFNGIIAAAICGALLGAAVKRFVWHRRLYQGIRSDAPEYLALRRLGLREVKGRAFWRWFTFRWRFDIWLAAFGAIGLWLTALIVVMRPAFSHDLGTMTVTAWAFGLGGVVLLGLGLWASAQFWRTGEHLADAESAS